MGHESEPSGQDEQPEAGTQTPEQPTDPQPTPEEVAKASRRRLIIGLGGTVLVLVVVFWFIFSFIIDPQVVIDAFLSLDLVELGILALMAAATYVLLGITLKNTLGGLSLKDATLGMLASLAAKGSIPGPMDTAFRFRLAVAYDYSVEASSLSAATLKALDWIARLLMIPIAIAILVVSGQSIAGLEWLAVIGLVISVAGIAVLIGLVRSQRLARWIGDLVQKTVESLMRRLDREPPHGLADRIMGLREMGQTLMNTTGLLGLGLQLVIQAAWASILTLAMYFVGVDFAVLAVAGVMIFRLFQWLIPIPIGYGLIFYWQKRDDFYLLSAESARRPSGPAGDGGAT